jgi:hypothetical protein
LSAFTSHELNLVPFEGSWTGGQTVQHIILACSGFSKLFAGKKEKTLRDPEANIKKLDEIFLDFNSKMESPEQLKPAAIDYDKNILLASIEKIKNDLAEASETYDLTLTCLDFQMPGFENFTISEWIHFAIIHTKRHTHQLDSIYQITNKP